MVRAILFWAVLLLNAWIKDKAQKQHVILHVTLYAIVTYIRNTWVRVKLNQENNDTKWEWVMGLLQPQVISCLCNII